MCEIQIQASISASQRHYTPVALGTPLAKECPGGHTHLSLGYWAEPAAKRDLPCPQWYVQGRYWVNAACLVQAQTLSAALPDYLAREDDWELRVLRPELLAPLRRLALLLVTLGAAGYVGWSLVRGPGGRPAAPGGRPLEAALKSGIVLGFVGLLVMISAGPVWPIGPRTASAYSAADAPYQSMA
ncbi:MAG: hypothetical protein JNL09_10825, partial [Anaerolineales bacterium]|nr:hypothetical protein [Anaerolineales bacterium]